MRAILEHYRGNEQFVARILDLMDQSERHYRCIITPFLTPQEQAIAQKVIGKQLVVKTWGGYEQAESKRLAIAPFDDETNFEIVTLKGIYRLQERKLTHRDVLGALMHLGIERDQFGDILVQENEIYIFVRSELQEYIVQSLTRIAHYAINFALYEDKITYEPKIEWHHASVSSLRLDCIVAACIHKARSKAENLIKGKYVKVDHLPLEDCKVLCHNNCTVSVRGYGRYLIQVKDRTSRKGKLVIEIGTYQ